MLTDGHDTLHCIQFMHFLHKTCMKRTVGVLHTSQWNVKTALKFGFSYEFTV